MLMLTILYISHEIHGFFSHQLRNKHRYTNILSLDFLAKNNEKLPKFLYFPLIFLLLISPNLMVGNGGCST